LRVFVSSTLGELAAERAGAKAAIESLRLTPVMFELSARDHYAETVYRDYLEQSDVFVGVYWQSYGWVAPDREISGLEDEFRLSADKPRLIYIKEPAPDRDPRLTALIDEIWASKAATKEITDAGALTEQLTQDLALLLSERFVRAERRLPTGTVTFMFADVEDSTPLLEAHGDAFSDLLARFRRDADSVVRRLGGTVVLTEGDGFFAVFTDAENAVGAAVELQRTYASYPAPGPLRVRIGLHTGQGVVVEGEYVGLDVHRAARVGAAAYGGQILLSATTRELVRLPGETTISDLGWFELKGISRPEHLHQVSVPGITGGISGARARPSARAHLPAQINPIIGREDDIATVARMLEEGLRLLTLTGPGGIGKTRLAIAAAAEAEPVFRDGIGFVDLAEVSDAGRVPEVIAEGLGRMVEGAATGEEVIVDELRDRQFLLILDNFEQVTECAPMLRRMLDNLPHLQIMVTSRMPLNLSVEKEYQVAPLQLPSSDAAPSEVAASPAVKLLVDRGRAVRPDLAVTEDSAPAMAELVRRLDGIPLAIELAAARMRLLGPRDLLKRIDSVLEIGAGSADLPDRQRTLSSAIAWSYEALPPDEQELFARLGVFADGWTLEAAEAIAGDAVADVAAGLETLATHSLVRVNPGAQYRMRMLSPLRAYALDRLKESGSYENMRDRHASYFGELVGSYPRGTGEGLEAWRVKVDSDWSNVSQAVSWSISRRDHAAVARFVASTWPLVWLESRYDETADWITFVSENLDALEPKLRAEAMYVEGFFALETGDFARARDTGLATLAAAEAVDNEELMGRAMLVIAGSLPAFDFEDPRIGQYIDDASSLFRRRSDLVDLAYALNYRCSYQAAKGNFDAARASIEEALALASKVEALPVEAQSAMQLAFLDLAAADLTSGLAHLQHARRLLEQRPNREVLTYLLDGFGWLALLQGEVMAGMTARGAAEGVRSRLRLRAWPLAAAQMALLTQLADYYEDPDAQAARAAGRLLAPDQALELVAKAVAS
jgi:predicted ATPase/class 3 adenylate cyclase